MQHQGVSVKKKRMRRRPLAGRFGGEGGGAYTEQLQHAVLKDGHNHGADGFRHDDDQDEGRDAGDDEQEEPEPRAEEDGQEHQQAMAAQAVCQARERRCGHKLDGGREEPDDAHHVQGQVLGVAVEDRQEREQAALRREAREVKQLGQPVANVHGAARHQRRRL